MSDESAAEPAGTRIQALLAHAGIASRRAAERMIQEGRVRLNGVVITELGTRALPSDRVDVDGRPVIKEDRLHYLAMNKPPGYLCAMSDDRGRPVAASLLKPDIKERVYNVGRLDLESCGLVLFTNDGLFARDVGHPSSGLVKEYLVETDRRINRTFGEQFEAGLADEGETLKAQHVELTGERSCLIKLVEGKNREIRRALKQFGLRALLLRRIAIGPVHLGDLAEGRWRPLTGQELSALAEMNRRGAR